MMPAAGAKTSADRPADERPLAGLGALALDVRGLSKRYGRRTVVNDLDLRVPAGAVAGFIGPNGAGKTTTLRMLLGLVRPTAGAGSVLGQPLRDPARYLPRIGALIESPALYPRLSARRNLEALALLAGLDVAEVDPVLAEVGLAERAEDEVRSYSLGMKQRLAIAAALLGDPDLLVLDEPTNGLDPLGIRLMRELIRGLAVRGDRRRTVVVSSHLLAEVEQICDWIIVVDRGRLAYQGPPDGLLAGGQRVTLRPELPADVGTLADLAAGLGFTVERDADRVLADFVPRQPPAGLAGAGHPQAAAPLAELNRAAHARGITLVEIAPARVTLEERYTGLITASSAGDQAIPTERLGALR